MTFRFLTLINNEILTIEIINKKNKNFIVSTCYRPPNGKIKHFSKYLKHIFNKITNREKKKFRNRRPEYKLFELREQLRN